MRSPSGESLDTLSFCHPGAFEGFGWGICPGGVERVVERGFLLSFCSDVGSADPQTPRFQWCRSEQVVQALFHPGCASHVFY